MRDGFSRLSVKAPDHANRSAPSDALLEQDARCLKVLPVSLDVRRKELTIAIPALHDAKLKDKVNLALLADYRICWIEQSLMQIAQGLDAAYGKRTALDSALERVGFSVSNYSPLAKSTSEHAVVSLVRAVFEDAAIQRASDIHFSPDQHQLRLRFRIEGVLVHVRFIPLELYAYMLIRIKVLANLDIAESRMPQDGQLSIDVLGEVLECRVSTFPVHGGENTVIRLVGSNRIWQDLDQIIRSKEQHRQIMLCLNQPQGLIIVCGPTGSGKTTTLYSMIKARENDSHSVMTLEDPIEFLLPRVKQSTLGAMSKMSMADAIRGLLRQDPDILLVGEIRDPESSRQCIRASLSGRLMLTTIHAADCLLALQRLTDLCGDRSLVAASVTAVISQRLMRVVCTSCRGNSATCVRCSGGGYGSRQGIFEILSVSSEMRELIRRDAPYKEMSLVANSGGYKSLRETAREMLTGGIVDRFEFERVMGPEQMKQ